MDAMFLEWAAALTTHQRTALVEWQKTNRFYEAIQQQLRQPGLSGTGAGVGVDDLLLAVFAGRLSTDIVIYRGLRNWQTVFRSLQPGELAFVSGFMATSVSEEVAQAEFGRGRHPALLQISRTQQTRAAWVAGVGENKLRYQGEVLLPPIGQLRTVRCQSLSNGVPSVDVDVLY